MFFLISVWSITQLSSKGDTAAVGPYILVILDHGPTSQVSVFSTDVSLLLVGFMSLRIVHHTISASMETGVLTGSLRSTCTRTTTKFAFSDTVNLGVTTSG